MARFLDFGGRGSGAESSTSAFLFIIGEKIQCRASVTQLGKSVETSKVRQKYEKVRIFQECLAKVSPRTL